MRNLERRESTCGKVPTIRAISRKNDGVGEVGSAKTRMKSDCGIVDAISYDEYVARHQRIAC